MDFLPSGRSLLKMAIGLVIIKVAADVIDKAVPNPVTGILTGRSKAGIPTA